MDCVLKVPFPSLRLCQVAKDALGVDPEPKRSGVRRELEVDEEKNVLICTFNAQDPRSENSNLVV